MALHVPELASVKDAFENLNFNFAEEKQVQAETTAPMSLFTVPLVMGFVENFGGKSYVKREIAMRIASSATKGSGGYKCEVPTSIMHRNRHLMRTRRPMPKGLPNPKVTVSSNT